MAQNQPSAGPPPTFEMPSFDVADLMAVRKSWIAACWATCAIAIIVVSLRMFARATKRGSAGWDDWTILLAMGCAIGDTVSNNFQTTCATFSPCFAKASSASQQLNTLSLGFMRLSVCIFVLRLLPPNSQMTKYTTWVAIGLNFVATMVCIGTFGALNPYSGKELYNVSRDLNRAFTASGILSIFTDFVVVLIPIFVIYALQMKRKTKIGACAIIALGLGTASLSIAKLVATQKTDHQSPVKIIHIQLLSDLEQNFGIIFACCPALRQLYGHVESKLKSYRSTTTGSSAKPTPLISRAGPDSKYSAQSASKSVDVTTSSSSEEPDLEKGGYNHSVNTVGKHTTIEVHGSAVSDREGDIGMIDENTSRYWGDRR